ncbi:hypothetical protein HGRIS_006152 [Hohenbuehelia grisea]|uniref:Amine oxidase domain-containing protein n=1 Tax=Hohenbuehelia grisea TaxID=104357 RepID=A0ABR3K1D7_9AGAR
MDFPARTLLQFMNNHHLLQITGKPKWLTIQGGSINYVQTIVSKLASSQLHLSTPIQAVKSQSSNEECSQVTLVTADGKQSSYDHVILACHSDTALSLLRSGGGLTSDEEEILGRVRWNKNVAVLHSDTKLMPRSRLAWSCWNYLTSSVLGSDGRRKPNADQVALTYWINQLQHISEKKYGPVLVTLNPPVEPDKDKVVGRYNYEHPVIDSQAIRSQLEMPVIQGKRGISYAGAWLSYGFHEDGFASGLHAVVNHIPNVRPPFPIEEPDREPQPVWIAHLFDLLEGSGTRVVLAGVLSWWLGVARGILGIFFDLRHIGDVELTERQKSE